MATHWLSKVRPLTERTQSDLNRILHAIVDEAVVLLDADRGTFYLVDHATRELVSRAAHLPEIAEIRLRMGEGVAGWVAQHAEAIRVSEHEAEHRIAQRIDHETGYTTRNLVSTPILDMDRTVMGVLQLLNKSAGDFTEGDLERLREIGYEASDLLRSTSLANQLRPDHRQPLAFRFNHIVGDSSDMQGVYERVERAAMTDATVAIRGETGTGKELIARAVHFNSQRSQGPFVTVDCAALPESLIENELFGHEQGAFTGADRSTEGKVASAAGGTLFLDEIGELSLGVQGKLLRLLQEKTYHRVGGTETRNADVRFVVATHRDLERLVQAGDFRQDLYYRLRVVEIQLPPLRNRGHGDLDRLIDHFVFQYSRHHNRAAIQLSHAARSRLHAYAWPGNVRELEHAIESAIVLAPGPVIGVNDLPLSSVAPLTGTAQPDAFMTPMATLAEVEVAYIRHVLKACDGNRSEAARRLGIGRNTLNRKLKADEA